MGKDIWIQQVLEVLEEDRRSKLKGRDGTSSSKVQRRISCIVRCPRHREEVHRKKVHRHSNKVHSRKVHRHIIKAVCDAQCEIAIVKVKNQLLKEMYRFNLKEAHTQIVIRLRQVLTKAPTAHNECIPWSTKEVI